MDKDTVKWVVLALIAICGMVGYKVATRGPSTAKASAATTQQQPAAEPRFGVITAILYCDDEAMIMMEDQVLHEGDTIHEVTIQHIGSETVEFEKQGVRWEQRVQEPAKTQWWKKPAKST